MSVFNVNDPGLTAPTYGSSVSSWHFETDSRGDFYYYDKTSGPKQLNFNLTIDPFTSDGSYLLQAQLAGGGQDWSHFENFYLNVVGGIERATLVAAKADNWSYLDDGSNQGTAWRATDYVENPTWETGQATLGYGETYGETTDVLNTKVDYIDANPGQSGTQKNATTYFRKWFDAPGYAADTLALRMQYDDGVAVYLNGEVLGRKNLDAGAAYDTYTEGSGGHSESAWEAFEVPQDLLVGGRNLLAVEIHQTSNSSSDIRMDLELFGQLLPGLSWDGQGDGDWSSADNWVGDNPSNTPDIETPVRIHSDVVSLNAAGNARSLAVDSGELALGAGNTLALDEDASVGSGTLSFELRGSGDLLEDAVGGKLDAAGIVTLSGDSKLALEATEPLGWLAQPDDQHPDGWQWGIKTFDVIIADEVVGTFASDPGSDDPLGYLGSGVFFKEVIYDDPGKVQARVLQAAPGDTDGSGSVEFADIAMLLASGLWNKTEDPGPGFSWPPTFTDGDYNGDGFVSFPDIAALLATGLWNQGRYVGLPKASIAAVPEPSTVASLFCGAICLLLWRRRTYAGRPKCLASPR